MGNAGRRAAEQTKVKEKGTNYHIIIMLANKWDHNCGWGYSDLVKVHAIRWT
jgi:hypothetical protein